MKKQILLYAILMNCMSLYGRYDIQQSYINEQERKKQLKVRQRQEINRQLEERMRRRLFGQAIYNEHTKREQMRVKIAYQKQIWQNVLKQYMTVVESKKEKASQRQEKLEYIQQINFSYPPAPYTIIHDDKPAESYLFSLGAAPARSSVKKRKNRNRM